MTKRFVGIDPSTKTGLVILDEFGKVILCSETVGEGKIDPHRMSTMIDSLLSLIQPNDYVCIEGFGFASQRAVQMGGIGWGIRMSLYKKGVKYVEVSPNQLKKFASGKGNAKKDELVLPIYKKWGFEHKSDNVRDAYVLAQMCRVIFPNPVAILSTKEQIKILEEIKKGNVERWND